ncbi:MAG: electron transporter RnfD [Spirochaetes bacterium]|nr:electron transporter RnfD [Spirochaetota bacterium]
MNFISAGNSAFKYTGRIDFTSPETPLLIYAGSSISVRFTGTSVRIRISNRHSHYENAIGFLLDGREGKIVLSRTEEQNDYLIADNLENMMHVLVLWKRGDGCAFYFTFHGLILDENCGVFSSSVKTERCIECYGDSVSAGEICEASEFTGKSDPDNHDGKFTNSWFSYSMMTARNFNAEIHNIAQGGLAVLDDTGYFGDGKVGLVSTWDKLRYNLKLGPYTMWDFSLYVPHVVIMAMGQNDSFPEDYINYNPEKRIKWINAYGDIILKLRERYADALFVVITTLMNHDSGWDDALDEMVQNLSDPKIIRYRFKRNGCGTPGHLRISEHEEMAQELTAFLKSFGDSIWKIKE